MSLSGPYPISKVHDYVDSGYMGVYVLSRDGKRRTYVGRSDSDLAQRIVQSASEGDYSYFWFDYASSPMDGYKQECRLYHQFNPPDNTSHPAVPQGTNWRCPVQGCDWGY